MNYSIIRYILGWVIKFEAGFLLLPFIVGIIYRENDAYYYLLTSILCFLIGTLFTLKKPKSSKLYVREGFICVAFSWIVLGILSALPFTLTGDIPSFENALFESVSGLTTTGATILTDVEALSHSNLFWRSFTHWIGGMGVFVLMMALIPMVGGPTMNLLRAESPGPSVDKLVPRIKDTAKILYQLYIALTLGMIVLLILSGMPLFDSITTAFGTTGTGGFGVRNDGFASYTFLQQMIVAIFMMLSAINYGVYFLLLKKELKQAFALEEVKVFLAIILICTFTIFLNIKGMYNTSSEAFKDAYFQVASIMSTTGFATTNYELWPQLSKSILLLLTFIGGCAGSTSGGFKVSRLVILFKTIKKELSMYVHPHQVKKITINQKQVPHEVVRSTNVFAATYFAIMLLSFLLISVDNLDFTTNFSAVATTLNNVGPGFCLVGPTGNFSIFSPFSKCILIMNMLIGRLEIFPILVLFVPSCWKKH